jgi:hypothetical protein
MPGYLLMSLGASTKLKHIVINAIDGMHPTI